MLILFSYVMMMTTYYARLCPPVLAVLMAAIDYVLLYSSIYTSDGHTVIACSVGTQRLHG